MPGWVRVTARLSGRTSTCGRRHAAPTPYPCARWFLLRHAARHPSSADFRQRPRSRRQRWHGVRRPCAARYGHSCLLLDDLIARICAEHGVTEAGLRSRSGARRLADIRARIAMKCRIFGSASRSGLAQRFDRRVASLSKAVTRREGPKLANKPDPAPNTARR